MVDRYRSLGARMLKEPHGAYVTHADYEALEAKLAALVEEVKKDHPYWIEQKEACPLCRAIAAAEVTP